MPARHRGPAETQRLETRTQGQQHARMVADDDIRRAPLGHRLAADRDDAGEVLTVEAAGPPEGPAVAVEQQESWRARVHQA